MNSRLLSVTLIGLATVTVAQTPAISVRNLMTVSEFNAAGLNNPLYCCALIPVSVDEEYWTNPCADR